MLAKAKKLHKTHANATTFLGTEVACRRISYFMRAIRQYLEKESGPMKPINPLIYWRYFSTPELCLFKKSAEVIYVILSSSSICETYFRDYEYTMDMRRLRLKPNLAEKLVFIYCNKRIKI